MIFSICDFDLIRCHVSRRDGGIDSLNFNIKQFTYELLVSKFDLIIINYLGLVWYCCNFLRAAEPLGSLKAALEKI